MAQLDISARSVSPSASFWFQARWVVGLSLITACSGNGGSPSDEGGMLGSSTGGVQGEVPGEMTNSGGQGASEPGTTGGTAPSGTGSSPAVGTGGSPDPTSSSIPEIDLSDVSQMFQDDEPLEVLISEDRAFHIAQMLRIRATNHKTIEIANFAPRAIESAVVLLSVEGVGEEIEILRVKNLLPHGITEVEYPFTGSDAAGIEYPAANGTMVTLDEFAANGLDPASVSLSFRGEGELSKSLERYRDFRWRAQMRDFDTVNAPPPANPFQDDPEPRQARLYTGLLINMAHVLTDERFLPAFVAETIYDDDKKLLSNEEKEALYAKMFSTEIFDLGIVEGISGLGGPETFAVAHYVLTFYLYGRLENEPIHEFGHKLGFGHGSN